VLAAEVKRCARESLNPWRLAFASDRHVPPAFFHGSMVVAGEVAAPGQ